MGRLADWLSQEHWLVGASLMRVSLGAWAVYFYALHFPVRRVLWGPEGVWSYERFAATMPLLNIWQLGRSPWSFEVVYAAAILIAVGFTLGWAPRVTGALHWLMIWSVQERNPFITDGGDNIMRIVLLFLVLVNTGEYFSVGALRAKVRGSLLSIREILRPARAAVHNVGVLLIVAQLGLLYMSTGLYKAMGELWQTGTALYYILRVDEFSWPGVAEHIYRNSYLVVLGTYGTVLFEVSFLPTLFNRWTRYATIGSGIALHTGIALVMGLVSFSWSMLSIYPLVVSDEEYGMMAGWFRRRFGLKAFYDGWCPACTRSARWLSALDLVSLVEFVSFREPGVIERHGLDAGRAARRIQIIDAAGTVREGIDAMMAIAGRTVVLWPLIPLFWAGRLVAGQRFYDAVAARRVILIPGACGEHCAVGTEPATKPRA